MIVKSYSVRVITFFLIVIGLLLSQMPVYACSPVEDAFNYTLEDRINHAEFVLVGTVIGGVIRNPSSTYEVLSEAEVEVSQYLKGNGDAIVQIRGFGDGADCLSSINMEQEAIFFVDRNEDGVLQANYLAVHDATMTVSDDKIDEIIAITGENNSPAPLSTISQLLNEPTIWLVISGMILLLLCGGLFIQQRMSSDPRKEKPKRS